MPITLYKLDNQCEGYVAEQVRVPDATAIEAAVGQALDQPAITDFGLGGYRVTVAQGTATVDLRLAMGARRSFQSLSSCEQMALFGSVQRTLTGNAQWQIKSVRFTHQGKEIVL